MSRQSLELRMGQHLTLTPALQQSIRLLQLSTLDLELEVARALAENPLLDTPEPSEAADTGTDGNDIPVQTIEAEPSPQTAAETPAGGLRRERDDEQLERPESAGEMSLREHLLQQLGTTHVSERDAALVSLLIDDLNDDGMMESSLPEVLSMLDPQTGVDLDELGAALRLLQSFDPPGVGARDLSECLLLQLEQPDLAVLPVFADEQVLALGREICQHHLDTLATGNLGRLREQLDCPADLLQQACTGIRRLNPRPASQWTRPAADFAVPDVIARRTAKGWQIQLNESVVPKLCINEVYAQALGSARSGEHTALHGQLQEARWLIRNVSQRFETIMRVSQAIADHQQAFFDEGWGAIRPLTLREVSGELGLHESTVSRATTQKFMLTPFGTVELKRFFGGGLSTEGREATSSTAVQSRIKGFIQSEDRAKPLSDAQLVKLLEEQGITIARRTVAKYREQMRIPTASLRKSQASIV